MRDGLLARRVAQSYWICSATQKLFIQSFSPWRTFFEMKGISFNALNLLQIGYLKWMFFNAVRRHRVVLKLSHGQKQHSQLLSPKKQWLIWLRWRERERNMHREQFNSFRVAGKKYLNWGFHLVYLFMSTHGDPFEFVFTNRLFPCSPNLWMCPPDFQSQKKYEM